ncbi:hypothetical protein GB937_000758 [Aspergillus fischeri]|nr:hypothetical protein GB937_000758 [Aspergillus fischeri]
MEPSGDKYGRKKQEGELGAVELWRKRLSRSFEIRTKPKVLFIIIKLSPRSGSRQLKPKMQRQQSGEAAEELHSR